MLALLIKFVLPLLALYYGPQWLRRLLASVKAPKNLSRFGDRYPQQEGQKQEDVIEICPSCGNVREKFHRCRFKD